MGFNGFQPSVWWCISSIHLSGTCPGPPQVTVATARLAATAATAATARRAKKAKQKPQKPKPLKPQAKRGSALEKSTSNHVKSMVIDDDRWIFGTFSKWILRYSSGASLSARGGRDIIWNVAVTSTVGTQHDNM